MAINYEWHVLSLLLWYQNDQRQKQKQKQCNLPRLDLAVCVERTPGSTAHYFASDRLIKKVK